MLASFARNAGDTTVEDIGSSDALVCDPDAIAICHQNWQGLSCWSARNAYQLYK